MCVYSINTTLFVVGFCNGAPGVVFLFCKPYNPYDMKQITVTFLLFLLGLTAARAQYNTPQNNVWAFGWGAGLDFNSGSPVSIASASYTWEGNASVCDASGALLFYTDGVTVFNRAGTAMPSGATIVAYPTNSATQGAVIARVAGSKTQYYVFSIEQVLATTSFCHLSYSIVDMSLAGGMGDVVAASMGTPVNNRLCEKMITVPGKNCDLWVLVHSLDAVQFLAYNISDAGITGPVISNVGALAAGVYGAGVIKISPDYTKIVSQSSTSFYDGATELYDFDNATGLVSNCQVLSNDHTHEVYGAEFSPDNTKLYSFAIYSTGTSRRLEQFDLSAGSTAAIVASKTTISVGNVIWDLRLGPDGKIYIPTATTIGALTGTGIGCINNPNVAGAACAFTPAVIALSSGQYSHCFPSIFMDYTSGDTTFHHRDTAVCITPKSSIGIKPLFSGTSVTKYLWNDGTTADSFSANAPGTYWVLIDTGSCNKFMDSITVKWQADTLIKHRDTEVCIPAGGSLLLIGPQLEALHHEYLWNDGSTNATHPVTGFGTYSVYVDTGGCFREMDSIVVKEYSLQPAPTGSNINLYSGYCGCWVSMPTAFTPNADGLNDVIHPLVQKSCKISGYLFNIYNRWGELIFSSVNPGKGWDGNYKGVPCDIGTYYYMLGLYIGSQSKEIRHNGDITLIR